MLDDAAHGGADGDPDVLEVLGGARVLDVLGRLAAHRRQRPLDGADDVGQGDLLGRLGEPVAAVRAALAAHEPGVAQVGEDVLEELRGDRLGGGQRVALDRPAAGGGELGGGAQRVVGPGGDAHGRADYAARIDTFTLIVTGGLVLMVLAVLALGQWYPGSGAEQLDWKPTRSPELEAENEIDDVAQMLEAQNERRRRRGAPERTEEEIAEEVSREQRAMRERAAAFRAREGHPPEE